MKNLLRDRVRFLLSAIGVGLAIMLALLLSGFESGLYRQLASYLEHTPGSIVVAQEGVDESLAVVSTLPQGSLAAVAGTDGVARAIPVVSQFVILDLHERKLPVYLVGYDADVGGGPWRLTAGRQPEADNEAVVDATLAERHGLGTGDELDLMGDRFQIVGLSDGTVSWMASYLFISTPAARQLLGAPSMTSYIFATSAPGVSDQVIQDRLARLPGVEVTAKADVIAHDRAMMAGVFAAPVRLMTGIAFVVGTMVVGLILYTATLEKRREFGVIKAVGGRNLLLYRVTATQALAVAVGGSMLGVGLTMAAAQVVMRLRPEFLITVELPAAGLALVSGVAMALIAGLVPARLVAKVAPADVFRSRG